MLRDGDPEMTETLRQRSRACDRCHALKESCQWPATSKTCLRCSRSNISDCRITRPLKKAGRRRRGPIPRVSLFGAPDVKLQSRDDKSVFDSDVLTSSENSSIMGCSVSPSSSSSGATAQVSYDIPPFVPHHEQLEPDESNLLALCIGTADSIGRFTIGRSFHRQHQRAMLLRLDMARPMLKDAFMSCAMILAAFQNIQLPRSQQRLCQAKAAASIATLRSLQPTTPQDVSICLTLGVTITTFALYVAGGEVFYVAQHVLSLLRPMIELKNGITDPDDKAFLICLIFTELVECLLRCKAPTVDPSTVIVTDEEVDRYLGICTPLLPIFHDVCLVSCSQLRYGKDDASIEALESQIDGWHPNLPDSFIESVDDTEIVNILSQTKILRSTALLILHRLRYAYGLHNDKGLMLAQTILAEMEFATNITGRPVKCADLGLLASALEFENTADRERAISLTDRLLHYATHVRHNIKDCLTSFWLAKECSTDIHWCNVHHYWKGFADG